MMSRRPLTRMADSTAVATSPSAPDMPPMRTSAWVSGIGSHSGFTVALQLSRVDGDSKTRAVQRQQAAFVEGKGLVNQFVGVVATGHRRREFARRRGCGNDAGQRDGRAGQGEMQIGGIADR